MAWQMLYEATETRKRVGTICRTCGKRYDGKECPYCEKNRRINKRR